MYLKSITIENIRSIKSLRIEFGKDKEAGWHVILGDNGSGKSTLIRALALGLAGPTEGMALRQPLDEWLRADTNAAEIGLKISWDERWDKRAKGGNPPKTKEHQARLRLKKDGVTNQVALTSAVKQSYNYLWSGRYGWFSASFGPFRRFTGGNRDYERLFITRPLLARHLTAFGEDVALTECLEWIQRLYVLKLEGRESGALLERLKSLVNDSELLPSSMQLSDVRSDRVYFRDENGVEVPVESLSDGYRSVLSMTFELIRQMVTTYEADDIFATREDGSLFVQPPGVVLIDEVDAHLHPTWQTRIGSWFLRVFPNVQFIVTTHSPLVCRAAEDDTIWRIVREEEDGVGHANVKPITGVEHKRLAWGSLNQALESQGFGLVGITRSPEGRRKLERLSLLNRKAVRDRATPAELRERDELARVFGDGGAA